MKRWSAFVDEAKAVMSVLTIGWMSEPVVEPLGWIAVVLVGIWLVSLVLRARAPHIHLGHQFLP